MTSGRKARLLLVSAVHPFPGESGQQMRVHNTLVALAPQFEITFLTFAHPALMARTERALAALVDRVIVLHSVTQRHFAARLYHKIAGGMYALATGLKTSNYTLGSVELSPRRIAGSCSVDSYDVVLYEYWHTHGSVALFQRRGIPCVLDMHNVLWRSYERQLDSHPYPWMRAMRRRLVRAYRRCEETAWAQYDALIAISAGEAEYARSVLPEKTILLAPMGADLKAWPYSWSPAWPPRLGFYGSLGSAQNESSVLRCVRRIMPLVWRVVPEAEFWVVGANPRRDIRALQRDPRVHVTGFVADVARLLASMSAVLCPWQGTYGFRSRLIEVMALGVPVVASPDAVYGMGLETGRGVVLAEDDAGLAAGCLELLHQPERAREQSRLARRQAEQRFSFEATYGRLVGELHEFVRSTARVSSPRNDAGPDTGPTARAVERP